MKRKIEISLKILLSIRRNEIAKIIQVLNL